MPQINVATPFKLQTLGADKQPVFREFSAGLHDVDAATAEHPYVKANLVNARTQQLPAPGTPQAALLVRQAAEAAASAVSRVLAAAHGVVGEAAAAEVAKELHGEPGEAGPSLADVLAAVNDVGTGMRALGARVAALEAGHAVQQAPASKPDVVAHHVTSTDASSLGGAASKPGAGGGAKKS